MNSKAVRIMLAAILTFSMVMVNICMVNADAAADWYDQKQVNYSVVVSASDGYVNLRSGPGTDYGIITSIENGTKLDVFAEAKASNGKSWGQIKYEGLYGWIALSQVEYWKQPEPAPTPKPDNSDNNSKIKELYTGGQAVDKNVVVSAPDGGVNLRFGPGTEYDIEIPMVSNNTVLHVTKEAFASNGKKWGYVNVGGVNGWIFLPQTTEVAQEQPEDQNVNDDDNENKVISSNEGDNTPQTDSGHDGVPLVFVVLIVLIVVLIALLVIILVLKKRNDGSFNE